MKVCTKKPLIFICLDTETVIAGKYLAECGRGSTMWIKMLQAFSSVPASPASSHHFKEVNRKRRAVFWHYFDFVVGVGKKCDQLWKCLSFKYFSVICPEFGGESQRSERRTSFQHFFLYFHSVLFLSCPPTPPFLSVILNKGVLLSGGHLIPSHTHTYWLSHTQLENMLTPNACSAFFRLQREAERTWQMNEEV